MQRKPRLLIVEDEAAIRTGLVDVFVFHGYDVDFAVDGNEGLAKSQSGQYDLIILDVMLPGVNGFDICEAIRAEDRHQPIIMLTAKSNDEDIIQGLSLGADDYVAKPFSVAQLVLRVQAVLRRTRGSEVEESSLYLSDNAQVDTLNLSGSFDDREVTFTRREMDILQYLYEHRDRPVSREELLHKVWGYARDLDIETRTVDIHIAKLRRKIEPDPKQPCYLITVRGGGYKLMAESR
ncbi:DNA-binding response regulator [Hahella sp. CCB-MM4]|uniref:response regulator transcription factor n=1 Tax=Hahella sp. (strain CCB-MM4) TaxID=1926491 RepID=UPI000B9B2B1E|nr:response regulator transcription factor [Hahella sp. CCB-MM4]OZG69731.1 DNA-binding response regulator [Hahella sp. CCB-MM4]